MVILLLLVLPGVQVWAADLAESVAPIYFVGASGVRYGTGVVVGDGGYVVTTADLAKEQVGPKTSITVKFPVVLVPSSGEAYRAETVFVDMKSNVAVLKLPVKGLPAAPLAEDKVIGSATFLTLGQVFRDDPVAGPWDSEIKAYSRSKSSGKLEVITWQSQKAFVTESKGLKWLFLSGVEPSDVVIPCGAPVTHRESGVAALYVSKFTIEGGTKPIILRMAVPAASVVSALQKAGANVSEARTPPPSTYKADGKESEAFQITSRLLTAMFYGASARAETEARALAALRPDNSNAQMLLGVALTGTNKAEEAVKAFDKALELDPKQVGVYLNRGMAYAMLKKVKEAESDYRKAMEESPRDVRPVSLLSGLLSTDEKRLDEGLQLADQAVRLEPENPALYVSLAHVLVLKEQYDRAVSELNQALTINPSFAAARAALGRTYVKAGKVEEAEKEYRKLAADEPKNPMALFELASFLSTQGKNDEANETAARILELNPPQELKAEVEKLLKVEKKTEEEK